MNKYLLLTLAFFSPLFATAQFFVPPAHLVQDAPEWAQLMYAEAPNVIFVTKAYRSYYEENPYVKNIHTKNYKFWKRMNQYRFKNDGSILPYADMASQRRLKKEETAKALGNWSLIGPLQSLDDNAQAGADQACVYTIDQSLSNPNIVYCGTEPGEVYKSTDGGDNWTNVSLELQLSFFDGAVTAIAIHPASAEEVLFASQNKIYQSIDGGSTWNVLHSFGDEELADEFTTEKILFHPSQVNVLFVVSSEGLFRSSDAGQTWEMIFEGSVFDLEVKAGADNVLYAVRNNDEIRQHEFLVSTDFGVTFENRGNVWYTTSFSDRDVFSGRLAVTAADPNRIYAYITGFSKPDDDGYIGLFRSDDAGESWTSPNGPIGAPFSESHPNLATGGGGAENFFADPSFCALSVSDDDPEKILIGGLNLWRSNDGGASLEPLGGYIDGIFGEESPFFNMHVDQQEFRVINGTSWITNDGGIYRSDDFFSSTNFVKANRGVHSTDFWGFGSGWNKDVLIGGAFHNGVLAYSEDYGTGNFLILGGGEPSSGYVNPGEENLVYSTDIGGVILPDEIGEPEFFSEEFIPNESFDPLQEGYSDLVFHPQCYSVAYTAFENNFWRTTDKGRSFELLRSFGQTEDFLTYIHISRENPNVMYMAQRLEAQNKAKLWKTVDAGTNWTEVNLPSQIFRFMMLQVDPYNPENIWIASSSAEVPSLVYKTRNGGTSWEEITSPTVEGEYVKTLDYIPGTNGGLYLGTSLGIYYRNDALDDWEDFSEGLPKVSVTQKSRPFYRDNKLRLSTTKGMWESELKDRPSRPFAQVMVDRIETCAAVGTTFRFVDYSYLQHAGATWNWTAEGGTVGHNGTWSTNITFNEVGSHNVILRITDDRGLTDSDTLRINIGTREPSIRILANQMECANPTSLDDPLDEAVGLFVAPNPSGGLLTINYKTEQSAEATLKVFDAHGRMMHLVTLPGTPQEGLQKLVDLRHLKPGSYWMSLRSGRRMLHRKIIVQ